MDINRQGLLETIKPPRLEDAGLEDCALPPEAIKEAFMKAANSIKSRAASIVSADDVERDFIDHLEDPGPSNGDMNGDMKDALVEVSSEGLERCGIQQIGGLPEISGDLMVVGMGKGEAEEKLLGLEVPENEDEKACVEGLPGLKIGGKSSDGYESEKEEKDEKAILVEAFM